MEIILINSPLFRHCKKIFGEDDLPPLGLGYIATYLEINKINVTLIDSISQGISTSRLKQILKELTPKFIGINIFSTNYEIVRDLIESLDFETHIIIGGLSSKSIYQLILNWETKNHIDIVIGDGELISLDIIRNSIKERPYFEYHNRRVYNIDRRSSYFINDISRSPLDRKFFPNEPLININGVSEVNIISSRGCINNCTFCSAARSLNLDFPIRERSVHSIIDELLEIKERYPNVQSIRILDDLFLKSQKSLTKAINIFSRFDFQWRSMAHVQSFNNITQEEINKLKESGCVELFIGIESGSPKILKSINKTSDINVIRSNLSKVFEAKIDVKCYFIFGFPDETIDDMVMTYKLAVELKELAVKNGSNFRTSVFQFRPYHGTLIYNSLKEKYPNITVNYIAHNDRLSKLIGRNQFNFKGNNYSKVSLKTIHDYICRTNMI